MAFSPFRPVAGDFFYFKHRGLPPLSQLKGERFFAPTMPLGCNRMDFDPDRRFKEADGKDPFRDCAPSVGAKNLSPE